MSHNKIILELLQYDKKKTYMIDVPVPLTFFEGLFRDVSSI